MKIKLYGAFVLNHRVVLHAIDATPAGGVAMEFSPLDRARTAASSPGNAPDALVDFHTGGTAEVELGPPRAGRQAPPKQLRTQASWNDLR